MQAGKVMQVILDDYGAHKHPNVPQTAGSPSKAIIAAAAADFKRRRRSTGPAFWPPRISL